MQTSHGYSERRACALTRQHRSTQRKPLIKDPRLELRQRMQEIVRTRVRYGYRRVHILLKREGWSAGRNLVYRLYCEEGLALRSKQPRRRKMVVQRQARCQPTAPERSLEPRLRPRCAQHRPDISGSDGDGRVHPRGAGDRGRAAAAGEHVVEVLNRLVRQRGAPQYLFADNGAEFTGHLVDLWAYHHGVRIDFSRPGKPTDNAHIETFNGSLRDECLNLHWFATIVEARRIIEAWRRDYNPASQHPSVYVIDGKRVC